VRIEVLLALDAVFLETVGVLLAINVVLLKTVGVLLAINVVLLEIAVALLAVSMVLLDVVVLLKVVVLLQVVILLVKVTRSLVDRAVLTATCFLELALAITVLTEFVLTIMLLGALLMFGAVLLGVLLRRGTTSWGGNWGSCRSRRRGPRRCDGRYRCCRSRRGITGVELLHIHIEHADIELVIIALSQVKRFEGILQRKRQNSTSVGEAGNNSKSRLGRHV